MTVGQFMETYGSILGWVITGGIAGYIASLLLRTERQGCFINVVLGVGGAILGAFVINTIWPDPATNPFNLFQIAFCNTILNGIVGAVLILIILELVLPGRQLGVRKSEGGGRRRRRRKGDGFNPLDFFNRD